MNIRRFSIASVTVVSMFAFASCGGDDSSSGSSSADSVATSDSVASSTDETLFTGEGDGSAFCNAARAFTAASTNFNFEGTPEETKAAFEEMVNAIDQLADMAPDEIKAEFQTAAEGVHTMVDLFAKYDYDVMSMYEDEEAINEMDAASQNFNTDNVDAYMADTCDIAS